MSKEPICDFCSATPIVKDYACVSFIDSVMTNRDGNALITHSSGKWGACAICRDLIDAEKWNDLAERSLETCGLDLSNPIKREIMKEYVLELHEKFRTNRMRTQ